MALKRIHLFMILAGMLFHPVVHLKGSAPVTIIESITTATPGTPSVPLKINVTDFTDIGQFTLTMRFDTTRLSYVSFSGHPSLTGMALSYTFASANKLATLQLTWTAPSQVNQSLPDSSILVTLYFNYLTGTGKVDFHHPGVCRYRRYVSGTLGTLNDQPKHTYYISGGISYRAAPITVAPTIASPAVGPLQIPITVYDFNNITAFSLYLEYDPTVITYQSFTKNSLFLSNFGVGSVLQSNGMRQMLIQWYDIFSVTLPDGSAICYLNFDYHGTGGTMTKLEWIDDGPSCQYSGDVYDVLLDYPQHDYFIDGYVGSLRTDIILRKEHSCGRMSVRLKPLSAVNQSLDNLVFTVTWPAVAGSDVHLTGLEAVWPGLQQDGPRVLHNGNYYVTFRASTPWPVSWSANTENTVATFRADGLGSGISDFSIIANDYMTVAPGLNTGYRLEIAGVDATHNILNQANSVHLQCGIHLKAFLQGPYNTATQQMNTSLATAALVPLQHPYEVAPWNYDGQEQITAYPAGLVDWVLVELRTDSAHYTVIDRRAALLLSDGTIVDTNGTTPLVFTQFVNGEDYHIVVYHRSHLPVMSKNLITLPNTPATTHDFTTNPQNNTFSRTLPGVVEVEPGKYAMIAGDLNYDNLLKYSGPANDRALVFVLINQLFPNPPAFLNSVITGYHKEDLNMDGVVRYSGPQNDQALIYQNISIFIPGAAINTVLRGQTPVSYE